MRKALLRAGRSVWRPPPAEWALQRITAGHPYEGVISKLPPLHRDYPHGTIRHVIRYGLRWEVDLSELIGWYVYWGFTDPGHDRFVALCGPGDVVLDVGANIGITALRSARAVGESGHVIAFEPEPAVFAQLKRHVALNEARVDARNLALGDRAGELALELVDPSNHGSGRLIEGNGISVRRLDDFALPRADVLKIDTEGFEARVLEGGRETITRHRPTMFIEVLDGRLREQGSTAGELLALIAELGYEARDVLTDEPAVAGSENFDVVCRYVRAG